MKLKDKIVTVIGAGRSGAAAAQLLVDSGAKVQVSESSDNISLLGSLRSKIVVEAGGHTTDFVQQSDLIIVSPGVPRTHEVFAWAEDKGVPVWGEIELAFRFCRRPIIAVTGSNGKTTVCTLISEVLQKAGKRVALCGNIGVPFSGEVASLSNKDFVVLEVSSFQLETIVDFAPYVAVLLNVTQNHLDRHQDIDEYRSMKLRIFTNQKPTDMAFLNAQDPSTQRAVSLIKARTFYFNNPNTANGHTSNPNFLAVEAVCQGLGVRANIIESVINEFRGVEHRLERVRDISGVEFINDSKATTAEAGGWALSSIDQPVLMICGGRDKNVDFSALNEIVRKKVKKMYVIGESKEKIMRNFKGVVEVEDCADLEAAVKRSKEDAVSGDAVLLSPMCTSFDMYKNYEERGEDFKRIVQSL